MVLIEKGYGKRIVGDNISNYAGGDLVLMGPDLPHIWQSDEVNHPIEEENGVKATVIYFPADFLQNLTDEQNIVLPINELVEKAKRGLRFYGQTSIAVANILSSIVEDGKLPKIISFLQAIELLSNSKEFKPLASVSYKNNYNEKDTGRINNVYRYLMQNFQRNISLQEVADLCNMGPNSFCRFFKSRTQRSFTGFLNELRIGHACKLLQNEDNSIADVCYDCGYNNMTNFNKFFKAIKHMTPSEYRKSLK